MVDAHRLLVLRKVAQAGSFAGATAVLRQTPSAVSQQIAALERACGVVVVHRSTRGVTLTPAGQVLLSAADAIDAELAVAERLIAEFKDRGPASLTVMTFPSAGEPLLAPALAALTDGATARGTAAEITVVEAEPAETVAALRAGKADLGIVYHFHTPRPPRAWSAPGTTYVPLVVDELRLVVPTGHRLAGRSSAALSDIADERWINGWGDSGGILDFLAAGAGFRPDVRCRSSDYRFMAALVGAGIGVCLVPELALAPSAAIAPLSLDPPATRFIGAYLPKRQWRNRAAEELLGALQAQARTYR